MGLPLTSGECKSFTQSFFMPAKNESDQESFNQSQKITISLFPADNARLTAVQMALARKGRRVSASHVIRLALRSVPVTKAGVLDDATAEKFLALLDDMKGEDGRAMRFAGK